MKSRIACIGTFLVDRASSTGETEPQEKGGEDIYACLVLR